MPKIRVPEKVRKALNVDEKLADCVRVYRTDYRRGQVALGYCSNGKRDYYLWNEMTQTREESWSTAASTFTREQILSTTGLPVPPCHMTA